MRRGFSLLELIVVIAIISVLASALVPLGVNMINVDRERETMEELAAIERAIYGKPELGTHGYLGDVGALPASIDALLARPEGVAAASYGTNGVPIGWSGPYLRTNTQSPAHDAWGQAYSLLTSSSGALTGHVRSNGADRAAGTGDDIIFPGGPAAGGAGAPVLVTRGGVTVSVYAVLGGWPVQIPAADLLTVRVHYPSAGAGTWTGVDNGVAQNAAGCETNPVPGWNAAATIAGDAYTLTTCSQAIPFGQRVVEVRVRDLPNVPWSNLVAYRTFYHGATPSTLNVYMGTRNTLTSLLSRQGTLTTDGSATATVANQLGTVRPCTMWAVAIGANVGWVLSAGTWTLTTRLSNGSPAPNRTVNWLQICTGL